MTSPVPTTLQWTLTAADFDRVESVLADLADGRASSVYTHRNASLAAQSLAAEWPEVGKVERFCLAIADGFCGLLTGVPLPQPAWSDLSDDLSSVLAEAELPCYKTQLVFDGDRAIAFSKHLTPAVPTETLDRARGASAQAIAAEPLLRLLEVTGGGALAGWERCRREAEMRTLHAVAADIRQEKELPDILQAAVDRACRLLEVDRVLVYQFQVRLQSLQSWRDSQEAGLVVGWDDPQWRSRCDCATYEARANDAVPSLLYGTEAQCFAEPLGDRAYGGDRGPWAVADARLETVAPPPGSKTRRRRGRSTKRKAAGHAELQPPQGGVADRPADASPPDIRAQLAVPIAAKSGVRPDVWGVLAIHQCWEPRQWSPREMRWLALLGDLMAVAIQRARADAQLQQQKQQLDRAIGERTQMLQEALVGAQSANRLKTEFLAAMSHELRTPLTCVIGLSATLLRWSFGQLSEKQRDYLQTIHDSGEHLLGLIDDILDLSQVEAGRAALNVSQFSLSQLVRQVAEAFRPRFLASGIAFEVEINVRPDRDRVAADRHRVGQILSNLLGNAQKFTPQDGRALLRAWHEGDRFALQVEDTGIGIPQNRIPLLFQKFQQLDASFGRSYGGLGLGLALTKQLVDLHDGQIEVESTVDAGSTFTVWLPANQGRKARANLPAADKPDGDGLPVSAFYAQARIALVDGQEESATATCDILTAAGYQVMWTADESMALPQVQVLRPALAIVSLHLPGVGGWEIAAALRQQPDLQPLKILLLADELDAACDRDPDLQPKVDACLSKPLNPELLLRTVDRLVRETYASQEKATADRLPDEMG